jgi:hypothetical protein
MIRLRLVIAFLAALTGSAGAQAPPIGGTMASPPAVVAPPATPTPSITTTPGVSTSRGAGLVAGNPGSPQMVTIPGSAVPGTLINNGNGTSTIMVPGSASEVVPTPR